MLKIVVVSKDENLDLNPRDRDMICSLLWDSQSKSSFGFPQSNVIAIVALSTTTYASKYINILNAIIKMF